MFKIDLHMHTPASVCGKDQDTAELPRQIVEQAQTHNLAMIAITDHHAISFIDRVRQAAQGQTPALTVLPGIELSTSEGKTTDIYFLGLFAETTPSATLQSLMDELAIREGAIGNCHFRINKTVAQIVAAIRNRGGLVIANHMDKNENRLAFIRTLVLKHSIRCFDLKHTGSAETIQQLVPHTPLTFFCFSDLHTVANIGKQYWQGAIPAPTFAGLSAFIEQNS